MDSGDLAVYAELGPPPENPLELATWAARHAAAALHQLATGGGNPELHQQIRELSLAVGRLVPSHLLAEVKRELRSATERPARPTRQRRGPKPTPVAGSESKPLRR